MNKKMGRPPTPPDKAKSLLVGAMVSPPEAEVAENDAAKDGQTKSQWLRDVIKVKINQEPPPPKWFNPTRPIEELIEFDGQRIEFTLTAPGKKIHGFGKLLLRQNGEGQVALDIDVVQQHQNSFSVTRYWLLPPKDAQIELHPDQTKARYRLLA